MPEIRLWLEYNMKFEYYVTSKITMKNNWHLFFLKTRLYSGTNSSFILSEQCQHADVLVQYPFYKLTGHHTTDSA